MKAVSYRQIKDLGVEGRLEGVLPLNPLSEPVLSRAQPDNGDQQMRTPRLCNWSGSPKCLKTATRQGRCDQHPRIPFDGAKQRWNAHRPPGYEALRRKVIRQARGRCQVPICDRPGAEVDKIVPDAEGGAWVLENLAYLCKPCHNTKTQQDALRGRQRGR